jgi:hypothetical protein
MEGTEETSAAVQEPPAETPKPSVPVEPITFCEEAGIWYFKQGNVKFPIDGDTNKNVGVIKSVAVLDKLNRGTWLSLASLNHLPCNPFNETLLKPSLIGVIQNSWYRHFDPSLKGLPELEAKQVARVEKYKAEIQQVKDYQTDPAKKPKKPKAEGTAKAPRAAQLYALATGAKLEGIKGQRLVIFQVMVDLNRPATAADITEKAAAHLKTGQGPDRVVAYYMNQEQKSGLIVTVTPEQAEVEAKRLQAMQAEFSKGLQAQETEKAEKKAKGTEARVNKNKDAKEKKDGVVKRPKKG